MGDFIGAGQTPGTMKPAESAGRLVLETGDVLKIQGDFLNTQKCIVSILENAK